MGIKQRLRSRQQPANSSTMKLLIVLGLFPLFSAQQGFPQGFMMGFPQGQARSQGNPQKEYNSNYNMWGFGMNNGLGMMTYNSNGNNNNNNNQDNGVFSLDKLNAGLIQQLRFMTDSLVNMLQQVAKDPRTNEVFKVMDKICVSNMDETIQMLKLGSDTAELSLLDVTDLLDDAVEGKVKSPEAARQEIEEKFNVLKQQAGATSSSSSRRKNYKKNYNFGK